MKRMLKRMLKQVLVVLMWYVMRYLVWILPLRVTYALGALGGRMLCAVSRGKALVIAAEFARIFPAASPDEIRIMVRDSFVIYAVSELEVLLYPRLSPTFVKRFVMIDGIEHLDAALDAGKGVLLFQAHFGAFQMVMPVIGHSGYVMNQISASAEVWKRDDTAALERKGLDLKARYERLLPVKHIPVHGSLRPVFRALSANEIVGVTIDGGEGAKTETIRFLGREANFQSGGVDLALRTGAAIVPAFLLTEKGLRHRLVLGEPVYPGASGDQDDRVGAILHGFAERLERLVREHPGHYGFTLGLRRMLAGTDAFPFFRDYGDGVEAE